MAYAFNDDKSKYNLDDFRADLLNAIYPVGSIYMSVNSTNPGTLFGGTWVAWSVGRVPVGINPNDADFNSSQKTGGAKTITLTQNHLPAHSHSYTILEDSFTEGTAGSGSGRGVVTGATTASRSGTTGSTGGGQYFTNLQPYIVCYMWKRTA